MWYNKNMKEFIKKNFILLIAFSLPLVLIAVVAISVYLPSLFLSTSYNFLYSQCHDGRYYYECGYKYENYFSVIDGKIVINSTSTITRDNNGAIKLSNGYSMRIFLHDTEKNESREINIQEAELLTLNNLLTSPDGVTISEDYESSPGFFIFDGGRSSHGYYLTKGRSKAKLNLINNNDRYYYYNNFKFIGWVVPGRS